MEESYVRVLKEVKQINNRDYNFVMKEIDRTERMHEKARKEVVP